MSNLYYIATAAGFVKEVPAVIGLPSIQKTTDARHATTYNTFAEADNLYRDYCRQLGKGEYYAILSNVCGTPV